MRRNGSRSWNAHPFPQEVTNIFCPTSLLFYSPEDPIQPASGSMKMPMTKWTLQKEYNQHSTLQDRNIASCIVGMKNIFPLFTSPYTEAQVAVTHN